MKAGSGQHFEQSYNAQAAVEVDSRLIVGQRVSQAPNDKQELVPTVAAIAPAVGSPAVVLSDSGFFSEAAVQAIEQTPEGNAQRHDGVCGGGEDQPSSERGGFGAEGGAGAASCWGAGE